MSPFGCHHPTWLWSCQSDLDERGAKHDGSPPRWRVGAGVVIEDDEKFALAIRPPGFCRPWMAGQGKPRGSFAVNLKRWAQCGSECHHVSQE
jgi:hypothetical protein